MKKSKSLVFAFLIASALVGNTALMPNPVQAAGTPNLPDLSSSAYNSNNIFTESGYKGQCTWFAYGRAKEKLGISLPSEFYGNAIDWWYANLRDHVYNYGTEPKPNSIVVWYGGPRGYGHVAYVEDVIGDTVFFNEGNFQVRGNYEGHLKALSKEQIKNRGNIFLKGYIYIGEGKSSGHTDNSNTSQGSNSKTSKVSLSNAGSSLNVRSSSNTNSSVVGSLRNGDSVKIIEQQGSWYKISYGSGYGYVYSKYIKDAGNDISNGQSNTTPVVSNKYGTVNLKSQSSCLNIRSSASLNSSVIGTLQHGSKVAIIESTGEWLKISSGSKTGYVYKDYVKEDNSGNENNPVKNPNYATVSLKDSSSFLNLRTSPWYGRILSTLSNGTKLQLLGTDGLWYKVQYNNSIGYVHSDYIKK
ncbi:SH3 domain-containing protein [Clostridium sp. JN-9]|uniref:SH3 domain-containing protein n=1 Tax=Clostridium sp. JN-9 TaxID=2507159 RepID=UPI000FFE0B0F|nr:SH3 domain-containing protein [Clostridium sp. JN-9]QAT40891.1 CHAP domain-containing protein [Clostridium sp. JN-9]